MRGPAHHLYRELRRRHARPLAMPAAVMSRKSRQHEPACGPRKPAGCQIVTWQAVTVEERPQAPLVHRPAGTPFLRVPGRGRALRPSVKRAAVPPQLDSTTDEVFISGSTTLNRQRTNRCGAFLRWWNRNETAECGSTYLFPPVSSAPSRGAGCWQISPRSNVRGRWKLSPPRCVLGRRRYQGVRSWLFQAGSAVGHLQQPPDNTSPIDRASCVVP